MIATLINMTKPRKPRTKKSYKFREWFNAAMEKHGDTNVSQVAKAVDTDYNHLWRIVAGDKERYGGGRPLFQTTAAIGEYFGDRRGALIAAGYMGESDTCAPTVAATDNKYPFGRLILPGGNHMALTQDELIYLQGFYQGRGMTEQVIQVQQALAEISSITAGETATDQDQATTANGSVFGIASNRSN